MTKLRRTGGIYRAEFRLKRTKKQFQYRALYEKCFVTGGYNIEHSHVPRPTVNAGLWYSDSYTHAENDFEIEVQIRTWLDILSDAYEVQEWQ